MRRRTASSTGPGRRGGGRRRGRGLAAGAGRAAAGPGRFLALVSRAQPAGVVGDCALGVVSGLVAGVLVDAGDVEVWVMARPVRIAAGGELDLRVRDDLPDRGGDLRITRRPSGGNVVGPVAQLF